MPAPKEYWRRICNEYHSFSKDKTYTNLLEKTASGLLADVLAKTTAENERMHLHSLEVFAAFCMYTAVQKLAIHKNWRAWRDDKDVEDILEKLYKKILKVLKENEHAISGLHLRNTIGLAAENLMRGEIRKRLCRQTRYNQDGQKIVEKRWRNLSIDEILAVPGVWEEIVDGGYKLLLDHERYQMLERAILRCREKNIISEEALMNICYFFGIGDGYPRLRNGEIAKKLGKKDAYVSRQRNQALKAIHDFIDKNKEFRDAIF